MSNNLHILILGAEHSVGRALIERAQSLKIPLHAIQGTDWDLGDRALLLQRISDLSPNYLITCLPVAAGSAADSVMTDGIAHDLADICEQLGIVLVHLSNNSVFAGQEGEVFKEDDEPSPQSEEGQYAWLVEQTLTQRVKQHFVLRVGWLFSSLGEDDVSRVLELARKHKTLNLSDTKPMCPTSACDVAYVLIAMVQQSRYATLWGTYHYTSSEPTTLFKFAEVIVAEARQMENLPVQSLESDARSPQNACFSDTSPKLSTRKILFNFGIKPRPWRQALSRILKRQYSQARKAS